MPKEMTGANLVLFEEWSRRNCLEWSRAVSAGRCCGPNVSFHEGYRIGHTLTLSRLWEQG